MSFYKFTFFLTLFFVFLYSPVLAQHRVEMPNLPFRIEKLRLDKAAKELKSDSKRFIALIGHNPTGKSRSVALRRLQTAKSYLIRKYKIPSQKIVTKFGGFLDMGLVMDILLFDRNPVETKSAKIIKWF